MKVTLNIENDAELRAHIKDAINGQVKRVIREEFYDITKDLLHRKIASVAQDRLGHLVNTALSQIIHDPNGNYPKADLRAFIEPSLTTMLDSAIKNTDWEKVVSDLAKEKIKAIISQ